MRMEADVRRTLRSEQIDSASDLYLKPQAKLELLSARWHSWSHLVSPLPRALNLLYRHIPLLESFIENPEFHVAASRDPTLVGGPFLELGEECVPAVRELLAETRTRCADLIELARQFREMEQSLESKAKGYCLDGFYKELSAPLAGYFTCAYDVNNHAVPRMRERMLYQDPRFSGVFEEVRLHDVRDSERRFFLNTPRLDTGNARTLDGIPFSSKLLDVIAGARTTAVPATLLARDLGEPVRGPGLARFFTAQPPVRNAPAYEGDRVRVRYFGHACVLVQTSGVSILLDPRLAFERDGSLATLTFDDLPDYIDYVFLTHSHQDHFDLETLLQLKSRIGTLLVPRNSRGSSHDPCMKLALAHLGFSNVTALDELESVRFADGEISAWPFPGEHCDLDVHSRQCAAVSLKGRKLLFLVDSDAVDAALYSRLAGAARTPDVVFMGMECHGAPLSWMYSPVLPRPLPRRDDDSRRGSASNCDRALRVVHELDAREVYLYAMGMEGWNRHLLGLDYQPGSIQMVESDKFVAECRNSGVIAERLRGCREFFF